jgi:protease-4
VYAVISDICASGCYYVVAAADKIYANKASIVGSIGVLMDGFGFVEAMQKLGIERRLLTAGENKALLDPFSPLNPRHRRYFQEMLKDIHTQFIDQVKEGRGDVLANNKDIFSGLVWTGDKAKELGLVDELGSASYVAREVIGAEEIVDFTVKEDLFNRFADRIGATMAKTLGTELMTRTPSLK